MAQNTSKQSLGESRFSDTERAEESEVASSKFDGGSYYLIGFYYLKFTANEKPVKKPEGSTTAALLTDQMSCISEDKLKKSYQ